MQIAMAVVDSQSIECMYDKYILYLFNFFTLVQKGGWNTTAYMRAVAGLLIRAQEMFW